MIGRVGLIRRSRASAPHGWRPIPPGVTRTRPGRYAEAMSEESNIRFVRRLWEAIREGGIEAGLELTPGVEWSPHAAGGRVLTSEELLQFFASSRASASCSRSLPYSFQAHGDTCSRPAASGCGARVGSPSSRSTGYTSSRTTACVRGDVLRHARRGARGDGRRRALTPCSTSAGRRCAPRFRTGGSATAPTPVRRLATLAAGPGCEVWLKDDGAYGSLYGGNKVRKLEWILPDVRRARAADDRDGRRARYEPRARDRAVCARARAALRDRAGGPAARRSRARPAGADRALRRAPVRTHGTYRTYAAAPWIMLRHTDLRGLRLPYFLTVGGSSPLGCLGFVEGALELARAGARGRAARALARRRGARLGRHGRGPGRGAAAGRPAHPGGRAWSSTTARRWARASVARLASRTLGCCAAAGRDVPECDRPRGPRLRETVARGRVRPSHARGGARARRWRPARGPGAGPRLHGEGGGRTAGAARARQRSATGRCSTGTPTTQRRHGLKPQTRALDRARGLGQRRARVGRGRGRHRVGRRREGWGSGSGVGRTRRRALPGGRRGGQRLRDAGGVGSGVGGGLGSGIRTGPGSGMGSGVGSGTTAGPGTVDGAGSGCVSNFISAWDYPRRHALNHSANFASAPCRRVGIGSPWPTSSASKSCIEELPQRHPRSRLTASGSSPRYWSGTKPSPCRAS